MYLDPIFATILSFIAAFLIFGVIAWFATRLIKDVHEPYYEIETSAHNTQIAKVYIFQRYNKKYGQYSCYEFELIDDKWHYTNYKSIRKYGILFIVFFTGICLIQFSLDIPGLLNIFFVAFIMSVIFLIIFGLLLLQVYTARKTLLELIRKETEV